MSEEEVVVVLITAGSSEEGERIARVVLEARLAACVNLVPAIRSLFWWEGKIDQAQEVLLLVKTRRSLVESLVERVGGVHSYKVFEAVALPVLVGNAEYLSWVREEASGKSR